MPSTDTREHTEVLSRMADDRTLGFAPHERAAIRYAAALLRSPAERGEGEVMDLLFRAAWDLEGGGKDGRPYEDASPYERAYLASGVVRAYNLFERAGLLASPPAPVEEPEEHLALRNCQAMASRMLHRKEHDAEWEHIARFCRDSIGAPSILRTSPPAPVEGTPVVSSDVSNPATRTGDEDDRGRAVDRDRARDAGAGKGTLDAARHAGQAGGRGGRRGGCEGDAPAGTRAGELAAPVEGERERRLEDIAQRLVNAVEVRDSLAALIPLANEARNLLAALPVQGEREESFSDAAENDNWPGSALMSGCAQELRDIMGVLNLCIDAMEGRDAADVCTELAAAVHRIDMVSEAVALELDVPTTLTEDHAEH